MRVALPIVRLLAGPGPRLPCPIPGTHGPDGGGNDYRGAGWYRRHLALRMAAGGRAGAPCSAVGHMPE